MDQDQSGGNRQSSDSSGIGESYAHRYRRQSSGGPKNVVVKIAAGGIAGLILGQLVLWWLPGRWGRDPFQLAPKLPAGIAFLAPKSLRQERPAAPVLPTDDQLAPRLDELTADDLEAEDFAPPEPAVARPNSPTAIVGLANAPRIGLEELAASLTSARQALEAASSVPDAVAQVEDDWYIDLCDFAHDVTFADTREPNLPAFASETRDFLLHVAEDPKRLGAIQVAAVKRLEDTSSDRQGIALTGNVTNVTSAGALFQTQLELAGTTVYVVSRVDPTNNPVQRFQVGDTVLIIGVIVADPTLHLLGYEGDRDLVVLGGMPVKVGSLANAHVDR